MNKRPLLLDFDGVIADTFHIAHRVAQKLCVFVTDTEYRHHFDGNIYEAEAAIRNGPDHGDRCDHALDWIGEYLPEFKTHAKPFSHMPELLHELSAHYEISFVSSTHNELIIDFLEKYGLSATVQGIYASEVSPRKDVKFNMIFEKYGRDADEFLFVTDTLGDVNEAASVGLASISVTWGFQDRPTLERGNPFAIVDSPDELRAAIERYFASAQ